MSVRISVESLSGCAWNGCPSQRGIRNLLKGFIIEREKVEKKDLINAPFTVIHPQGIRGVFSPLEINEILQLTDRLAA